MTLQQGIRVCPRCGEASGQQPFCVSCGLNLAQQPELPSGEEYAARLHEEQWLRTSGASGRGSSSQSAWSNPTKPERRACRSGGDECAASPKTSAWCLVWAKIVGCGLSGGGPTRVSVVGERFGRWDDVRGVRLTSTGPVVGWLTQSRWAGSA